MKRIVSALLVAGCLSIGAPSAFAAVRAPAPAPNAGVVCTLGSNSVSTASLVAAGLNPRVAQRIMNLIIAMSNRYRGLGVSCVTPVVTTPTPTPTPPPIIS